MDPMELDVFLYGDGDVDQSEPPAVPPDAGVAGWHNRKAGAYREQIDAEVALFAAEISRLQMRAKERVESLEASAVWHEQAVEAWHRQNVKAVGKTVVFPSGPKSQLVASAPKLVVQDEDALRAFLSVRANEVGESLERVVWVRPPERFMVSELKRLIQVPKVKGGREPNEVARVVAKSDGVEVPGIQAVVLPDRWQRGK
jgi:hypothetical protein